MSVTQLVEVNSVAQKIRELTMNPRMDFDCLKMTRNTCPDSPALRVEQIYRDHRSPDHDFS